METSVTVRLDKELARALARICRATRRSQSEAIRNALRRQIAILRFEDLRRRAMPFAEASGYLTDEDVFRDDS